MNLKQALQITGSLSKPSKMPCHGYSISARLCITGSKLRDVPGSVCHGCYALKGRYNFGNVQGAMATRREGIDHPQWVEAMVVVINNFEMTNYFRWHDAGDLQSEKHLLDIMEIARRIPEIKFWLPTREYGIVSSVLEKHVKPANLIIRLSAHMVDGPLPVALAAKFGLVVSGVTADKEQVSCPSSKQDNKCLRCRACWDSEKPVVYGKH